MSFGKRQLSNSKMKSDADLFKYDLGEAERKRPGSGQPLSTVKSPLPPRKPVYSGQQKQRDQGSVNFQDMKMIKSSNNPSKTSLTASVQQLPLIKSPQKASKPPIHLDRKLIINKQESHLNHQGSLTTEQQARNISNSQKISSAGNNQKQFTWSEHVELPKSQREQLNKRRLVSREKLQSLPDHELKQHLKTPQYSSTQKSSQQPQPKCYNDFTMTSGRNDLQNVLASLQVQIKQAASEADQNPVLNMSEIIEQPDDGCSSLAQSTLYQFQQ